MRPTSLFFFLCLTALFWTGAGCDIAAISDRPLPEELPDPEPVRITAGPWVSSVRPDRLHVCFVTDRPVTGGARLHGHGLHRVRRTSRKSRLHAIEFPRLRPGAAYRCEVLAPDAEPVSATVRTLPPAGTDSLVALVAGGPGLARALRAAADAQPDALLLIGRAASGRDAGAWIREVLEPNAEALRGQTLLWAPDPAALDPEAARMLFPAGPAAEGYAVTVGAVRLALAAPEEMETENLYRLEPWLRSALSTPGDVAGAAVLPRAPVRPGPNGLRAGLLQRLGPVFESTGTGLVIAGDGERYHRTRPIGTGEAGVQYVTLSAGTTRPAAAAADDVTAVRSPVGNLCLLRGAGGRLAVRTTAPGTGTTDAFAAEAPAALDRRTLVSAAWARVSQRREVRAVARQAARAVPNPSRPERLRFVVANPSPERFRGELAWRFAQTAFFVEPETLRFDLAPGEASSSLFRLRASGAETDAMPELTVRSERGGSATQRLLLTWRRSITVPRVEGAYAVDGRPEEDWWKAAADAGPFVHVDGAEVEGAPVRAWAAAGPEGLRIRFRCVLPAGQSPQARADRADGRVWRDESVEIFLDPEHRGRDFRQLSVSAAGVSLSAHSRLGRRWNPAWRVAVEVRDGRYNVEAFVPWAALGRPTPPQAGETWGLNLTRNDYTGERVRVYQTAPTHGSNARAGCYLEAVFE